MKISYLDKRLHHSPHAEVPTFKLLLQVWSISFPFILHFIVQ